MATAGRILIIPKGKYSGETQYEKLDMVSYDGKGWVCKKTCIGIEPTEGEYWSVIIDVSEELEKLVDDILVYITPQMFGAIGNGVADDTESFNRAISEHNATGNPIYVPKGIYKISGGLTPIETDCIIIGTGEIRGTDESGKAYLFNARAKTKISGLTIVANGYDGAILFESTKNCSVEDCTIRADINGVVIKNSSLCSVKDCYIVNANRGIAIVSDNVDTGDNYFTGNTFDCTDGTGKSALAFYSGGGIRFTNNKVLTYANGVNILSSGETSVLIVDGNSFENGDNCLNVANSSSYGRIIFSNNQITKYKITLTKNTYEVQITGNIITGGFVENSICCAIDDVQGKISFENNIVSGFRYGVYSYKDIKDLKISNNNYDDFCKKTVAGNSAIFNETYDKTIETSGSNINLSRVIPALNGSCIVEALLSGATNLYSILRVVNTDGVMTCENIHGDANITCNSDGTLVCGTSGVGATYAHITVKGCVNKVEA